MAGDKPVSRSGFFRYGVGARQEDQRLTREIVYSLSQTREDRTAMAPLHRARLLQTERRQSVITERMTPIIVA